MAVWTPHVCILLIFLRIAIQFGVFLSPPPPYSQRNPLCPTTPRQVRCHHFGDLAFFFGPAQSDRPKLLSPISAKNWPKCHFVHSLGKNSSILPKTFGAKRWKEKFGLLESTPPGRRTEVTRHWTWGDKYFKLVRGVHFCLNPTIATARRSCWEVK